MQTLELDGTRDVSWSVEVLLDYILLSPSVTRPIYGHRPCKEGHLADLTFFEMGSCVISGEGEVKEAEVAAVEREEDVAR